MENNNLMMISIVAIVAIVGMVFMFSNLDGTSVSSKGDLAGQAIRTTNNNAKLYPLECKGIVQNSLCHSSEETLFNHILSPAFPTVSSSEEPLIINNLSIRTNFPHEIEVGEKFTFSMKVTNPTDVPITFRYNINNLDSVFYTRQSINTFKGSIEIFDNCKNAKCYMLTIQPKETKELQSIITGIQANFFDDHTTTHRTFIDFLFSNTLIEFWNLIKFNEGIQCGDYLFPKQYGLAPPFDSSEQAWISSVCKNGVFYPGAECSDDLDCSKSELCVQGICINKDNYRACSYVGLRTTPIKAKGTKNILMFNFGPDANNSCKLTNPSNIKIGMDKIEAYYDSMASKYLNEQNKFINFNWIYAGTFDKDNFQGLTSAQIVDKVIHECGFNRNNYDFVIMGKFDYVSSLIDANWAFEEGVGLTRNLDAGIENSWDYTSLAHEIAHVFGCSDRHTNLGGSYQWDKSLMGQRRFNKGCLEDSSNYCNLDVCFAEMGWADLNQNNIYDIDEIDDLIHSTKPISSR